MEAKERIEILHAKMDAMRRAKERHKTHAIGIACASLAACLFSIVFGEGMLHVGGTAGVYSGSMMLFENAGGYVLLAIGAFMAGVIITVLLKRRQEKNKQNGPRETTKDKPKR